MKKIKDEWYKNKSWNGNIDSNFEKNLKYTRGNCNKAEYLQIQGCLLLENPQSNIQEVGVALLSRLFEDFPQEHSSIILAQEKLGDYYLQQNNYQQAIYFFNLVTKYCIEQNSRGGTSTMADLELAEALLHTNDTKNAEQAYELVMQYPVALLKINSHKFYYAALAARICHLLNKKDEAMEYAKTAIEIAAILRPASPGQKATTASKLREAILISMEEITKG
jgi:tetratricopeptide (TPR) repeat protein